METNRCIELDIMKFWGILLVVLGHVCNMYLPNGLIHPAVSSDLIGYISLYIYSFHMPLFVFVSGSVYAFQSEVLGRRDGFQVFIKKKAKRLLIPYVVFGLLLIFLMCGCGFRSNLCDYIFNGVLLSKDSRHLWFVLMLFEVFVLFYLMNRCLQLFHCPKWALVVLSLVCYLSSNYFPYILQINNAFRYVFWFTLGFVFILYKNEVQRVVVYSVCIVFLFAYLVIEHNVSFDIPFFSTITALTGILVVYSLSCDFKSISRTPFFRLVSKNSLGIYLYHVFVIYLMFFFMKELSIPAYLLSLSVFIISIFLSVLLTELTRKLGLGIIIGE